VYIHDTAGMGTVLPWYAKVHYWVPAAMPGKLCKPKKEIGQIVAQKVAN